MDAGVVRIAGEAMTAISLARIEELIAQYGRGAPKANFITVEEILALLASARALARLEEWTLGAKNRNMDIGPNEIGGWCAEAIENGEYESVSVSCSTPAAAINAALDKAQEASHG